MYFYELHEGDDELYSDVLLAREEEMPADEFFDLVQGMLRRQTNRRRRITSAKARR